MNNRKTESSPDEALLSWEQKGNTLFLKGTLDRDSLLPLWQQKDSVLTGIEIIDVSQLSHVDSTGLALFVRVKSGRQQQGKALAFAGIGERLKTLVALYGLQDIIVGTVSGSASEKM
ncbi:MAG: lipid asymmetry maintenance protein MlaB [Enterobacteriaceae bacterium]|jgi:phospholipid transport system transporter-binding protein|nr:lipid asymmetry maintenance protein MlaB [Enterobacteriaceae bacterium]